MKLADYGFIRAGVAVPTLQIGNPVYNCKEIAQLIKKAAEENVKVLGFPELSITGYTSADLFHQRHLLKESEKALKMLIEEVASINMLVAVGMPLECDNQLFNTAVIFQAGKILGVVPKTFIPNYNEYYEKRWFASSVNRISDTIYLCGQEVPFHENLLFRDRETEAIVGVEICEDLWMPIPPSSHHAIYGANILINLSASNEVIGKYEYRRDLVRIHSAKTFSGYLYASAGQTESTTDVVFSGHSIIAENGTVLEELNFPEESAFIYQDIDIERLRNDRRKFHTFMGKVEKREYKYVDISLAEKEEKIVAFARPIDPRPFVPANKEKRDERCRGIFQIQSSGLVQRLSKTGIKKAVVGISGGLDSTLALLVMVEAFQRLKLPMENIIGVTMPGFGTTDRTYQNAITLMKEFGITVREIPIAKSVEQHFKDIGYDSSNRDVVYENSQARERTQILMDVSNQVGGLVVGTGDLSELALGWATYNGDHMSMYAVNSGVPKTLVRYLVEWYATTTKNEKIATALMDVYHTPVSPELLPPDEQGNIQQKTEEIVGSYDLNDFFLYYMLRFGYTPGKLVFLAEQAFQNVYTREEIKAWLRKFYQRFFTQQFKRSCLPDGVKVGSINLSPRGDWRMPSDASYQLWVQALEKL
ncbi:NAD(+) synthase [Caldibacillus lycopersici]|uniref:Glutamine-dependent NAD(+) synthetase n=1 Tax=Perspicuibacillus lycopersici TaxID=1325689 RepID=A0AAE3IVK4_9BACI|nr:NAD(+) synthase [Perspicuibacillus lycopersici]MCU9614403.1 NAD(+) synthase [Perspicuibacillus lycopersici]